MNRSAERAGSDAQAHAAATGGGSPVEPGRGNPPFDGPDLRERRKALGWTIDQLADRCGLSAAQISNLETGKTLNPSRVTRHVIDAALREGEGARKTGR